MQHKYTTAPANPREARVILEVIPASANDETSPGFFRSHWRRVPTLLWLWLALPLFFLPWIDVRCNNERVLSQTGLQTCSGDYTLFGSLNTKELRAAGSSNAAAEQESSGDSLLSKVYFVCLVIGALLGAAISVAVIIYQLTVHWPPATFVARISAFAITSGHFLVLALGSLCFATLFCQIITGFPMERTIDENSNKASTFAPRLQGLDKPAATAETSGQGNQLRVSYTCWVWASLVISCVSALFLLVESLIMGCSVLLSARYPPDVIPEVVGTG